MKIFVAFTLGFYLGIGFALYIFRKEIFGK